MAILYFVVPTCSGESPANELNWPSTARLSSQKTFY